MYEFTAQPTEQPTYRLQYPVIFKTADPAVLIVYQFEYAEIL
jgi:hypothetical protein